MSDKQAIQNCIAELQTLHNEFTNLNSVEIRYLLEEIPDLTAEQLVWLQLGVYISIHSLQLVLENS